MIATPQLPAEEHALALRALGGDGTALRSLWLTHARALWTRAAWPSAPRPDAAAEVLARGFAAGLRSLEGAPPPPLGLAPVLEASVRAAGTVLGTPDGYLDLLDGLAPSARAGLQPDELAAIVRTRLRDALAALPEPDARLLTVWLLDGHSLVAAARVLGVDAATFGARAAEATRALGERLGVPADARRGEAVAQLVGDVFHPPEGPPDEALTRTSGLVARGDAGLAGAGPGPALAGGSTAGRSEGAPGSPEPAASDDTARLPAVPRARRGALAGRRAGLVLALLAGALVVLWRLEHREVPALPTYTRGPASVDELHALVRLQVEHLLPEDYSTAGHASDVLAARVRALRAGLLAEVTPAALDGGAFSHLPVREPVHADFIGGHRVRDPRYRPPDPDAGTPAPAADPTPAADPAPAPPDAAPR